jgi:hypothetical protein
MFKNLVFIKSHSYFLSLQSIILTNFDPSDDFCEVVGGGKSHGFGVMFTSDWRTYFEDREVC